MTSPLPTREPPPVEAEPFDNEYRARFRKSTGGWTYVCVNGKPDKFPTPDAALLAAWQARDAHFNGHGILSTGEKAKARAERFLFPGKGRVIPMVTR